MPTGLEDEEGEVEQPIESDAVVPITAFLFKLHIVNHIQKVNESGEEQTKTETNDYVQKDFSSHVMIARLNALVTSHSPGDVFT